MTREERLEWCKERARKYLRRGELEKAVTLFVTDMNDHPDTAISPAGALADLTLLALQRATNGDYQFIERYIEGFR